MVDIRRYEARFFDDTGKARIRPPAWQDWINVRDAMIVHTRGVVPKLLLETKRPNEPEDILKYRIGNYRPITKAGINTGIDSVFRILMGSNFQILPSPEISEYLLEKQFSFLDVKTPESIVFQDVFFRHVLRIMFDDPNAFLVWMPVHSEDPRLPPSQNEANEKIDIEPLIVDSDNIVDIREDLFAFSDKREVVIHVSKTQKEKAKRFFILTEHAIWRLEPFWNQKKKKIDHELQLWYNISLILKGDTITGISTEREFPGISGHVLGGNVVNNVKREKYFDSFFAAYRPFGDEAITTFSDNQAVNVRYNYPYVSIKSQKCYNCQGAGNVPGKTKDGRPVVCKTCNGNKVIPVMSPFGQYMKEPPAAGEDPAFALSAAVEFATPDVAILKHSFGVWQRLLELAEEAISVKFTDVAQSGVAKDIDRERKFELLTNISNNIFGLINWSLNIIQAYREPFKGQRKENKVKAPTSFNIKTVGALTAELAEMQKTSTPQSFIVEVSKELAVKTFNDGDINTRIVDVLTTWDALYGRTEQQMSTLMATQAITAKDITRSVMGYAILTQLSETNDFFKLTTTKVIELAEAQLDAIIPTQLPIVDASGNIT